MLLFLYGFVIFCIVGFSNSLVSNKGLLSLSVTFVGVGLSVGISVGGVV